MRPNATAEVVIPVSKRKLVLLLVGSVAAVGASIWIWSIAETQARFNPFYVRGVALAGAAFFGLCAVYGCIKAFDSRPGLIIDPEGLVDNSSAVAAGRIFWAEITGLKVSSVAGQRFLTITVVDPQKYVARGGVFKRMLNAANTKMTGSPINLSSNALRLKFEELVRLLTEAFDQYKRAG